MARQRTFTNAEVLKAIQEWIADRQLPPTVEELTRYLGVGSTRTALRYLRALEDAGDIERWAGARGMRVRRPAPDPRTSTQTVPIVGRAPAGPVMVAEQNIEGWLRLPTEFLRPSTSQHYLLRVFGNSMNRCKVAGGVIEDGDLVLVRRQADAQTGSVVVALLDGDATIKRLAKAPGYAMLRPVSSDSVHHPILVKTCFRVQGIVRRVFKRGSDLFGSTTDDTP